MIKLGFVLRSQPALLPGLGVMALTVVKVFIIDTATIGGIYRALSATGLGIVLLCIGWIYQRLWCLRRRRSKRHTCAARGTYTTLFKARAIPDPNLSCPRLP